MLLFYCGPLMAMAQTISFLPPKVVAIGGAGVVGECAACAAVADFNGDGKPDLAYNILTPLPQGGVLLGNGDGTFRSALPLPLPFPQPTPILTGDFNGDGKPDLLFGGSSVLIYFGKGDGTFLSPVPASGCSAFVAIGDFNRDGKTDMLCGNSLLLSEGNGAFTRGATIGSEFQGVKLVADFNGDGTPDILLTTLFGESGPTLFAVLLGRGDGTFGTQINLNYNWAAHGGSGFLAGDFNGDGKVDLIGFSSRGIFVDFLPGNGDGTFGTLIQTDVSAGGVPEPMTAVGDFNSDGKLDFIAGDAVFAGNGDGTFRFPVFFGPTIAACGPVSGALESACTSAHSGTAVSDFNGDGLPDLAVYVVNKPGLTQIKNAGEVAVLLNDSPGNGFGTAGVSAAAGTVPVGTGSIVSAYGVGLASETAVATTNPAPTTLGGIRLHVRDRSHKGDTLAPLLYVSPTQINYLLNSTDTSAWVDIERVGTPYVPQGMVVPIAPIAPGFFTAAYTANAPGYVSLYGTGFAQAAATASSCTVGDVNVTITYAGPEIVIPGLDQVNLWLPASLAGAGVQPVNCSFATAQQFFGVSNGVNVTIR